MRLVLNGEYRIFRSMENEHAVNRAREMNRVQYTNTSFSFGRLLYNNGVPYLFIAHSKI